MTIVCELSAESAASTSKGHYLPIAFCPCGSVVMAGVAVGMAGFGLVD